MTHTTYKRKEVVGWQEKKWWIWLFAILTAAGVLVVLLMQQNMPEKQKGGTLVQRQEATCYG